MYPSLMDWCFCTKETDASPYQILMNMKEDVQEFVKDEEQFDDLTMLCLEYKGAAG